ncbi:hypothetical protein RIF29_35664 [Crotalaria pallida]|uniref:H15 domain-containing protein n=1 Tax=Crotalaria pallida TaxID=3830 RepID=A0AAN9EG94_CROPI
MDPPPLRSDLPKIHHFVLCRLFELNPSLADDEEISYTLQQKLPHIFPSSHIPNHLPYPLMIENALKGLDERNGSTEEAISDFIKRENKELPMAHATILHTQLKMLCVSGDLVCNDGLRYVFVVDDVGGMSDDGGEPIVEVKGGSKKRKREKKKKNDGKGEKRGRIKERFDDDERGNASEDEGSKEQNQVSGLRDVTDDEPSRVVEEGTNPLIEKSEKGVRDDGEGTESKGSKKRKRSKKQNNTGKREKRGRKKKGRKKRCYDVENDNELGEERSKEQNQVSKLHKARNDDEPSRLVEECIQEQVEEEENCSVEVEEQGQAEKGVFELVGKEGLSECQGNELIEQHAEAEAPAQSEGEKSQPREVVLECMQERVEEEGNFLMEMVEEEVQAEKEVVGKQSQPDFQETRAIEQHAEVEAPAQGEGEKSYVSQIQDSVMHLETICSSHLTAPNFPVDSQQPLLVPISEGLPKGIVSAEIEQDDNPMSEDPEQKPSKPFRGRGRGRSRGRGRGEGRGRGRGWGSTPKPSLDADQCEEQSEQENRAQQHVSGKGRGSGRGQGRGRGRPRKLELSANQSEEHLAPQDQCEEQLQQEDRAQQPGSGKVRGRGRGRGRGSGRGRGRPPKLDQNANQSEEHLPPQDQCEEEVLQEDRAPQHGSGKVRGRGRGSGRGRGRPKLDRNANQSEEHLPPHGQAPSLLQLLPHVEQGEWQTCERLSMENALNSLSDANQTLQQLRSELPEVKGHLPNQDPGQDMPPNPMLDENQGHQLLQPQEGEVQPKRRGRPPKPKQD